MWSFLILVFSLKIDVSQQMEDWTWPNSYIFFFQVYFMYLNKKGYRHHIFTKIVFIYNVLAYVWNLWQALNQAMRRKIINANSKLSLVFGYIDLHGFYYDSLFWSSIQNCNRWQTIFLLLFTEKNKASHFMGIICLADDSHEMSSLIFWDKKVNKINECCLLLLWVASLG